MVKSVRSPRLNTILMVEQFIKAHDSDFRKRKLWESLPKKMMYQTFCVIIDYLLLSHKIFFDSKKRINWLYHHEEAKKFVPRKELTREYKMFYLPYDLSQYS